MKKIIDIPVVIDMRDFHEITEIISEEDLKKRLNLTLTNEIMKIVNEYIYYNPNDKDIA